MLSLCRRSIVNNSVRCLSISEALVPAQRIWKKCSAENVLKSSPKLIQPYLRLMRLDKPIGYFYSLNHFCIFLTLEIVLM